MDMTPEEAKEYADYLVAQHGFKPEEAQMYLSEQGINLEPTAWDTAKKYGGKALDLGVRGLDYAGGLARTGAANVMEPFTDENVVTSEDAINAFKGNAPALSTYMERAGVPEGARVNLFPELDVPFTDITLGKGDTSVRDAAGFVGEVGLDPLTYGTLGILPLAKYLGKAAKPLNVVSDSAKGAGQKLYKSGFKKIDEDLAKTGSRPLSDVMWKNGRAWGGAESLQQQAVELGDWLKNKRKDLYTEADSFGAKIDVEKASQGALNEAKHIQGIRGAEDVGQKLVDHVRRFYEPTAGPRQVGEYTVPMRKLEDVIETARPQYGPHGEVLNASELSARSGRVNIPSGTKEIREFDPLSGVAKTKDVPTGGNSYPVTSYDPKSSVQKGATIPESRIPIVENPSTKFNWQTMREEPVKLPPMRINEASDLKTRFYDSLPDSAFQQGRLKGDAQRVTNKLGLGMKTEIEEAANAVSPQIRRTKIGDDIADVNADWGSVIGAQKPLQKEVGKANTKNAISSVDAAGVGYAMVDPLTGIPVMVGKKLGDISKGSAFRTGGGKAMNALGETGLPDIVTRKLLIDLYGPESPYESMKKPVK